MMLIGETLEITEVLENVLKRTIGPKGLQNMIVSATGQLCITNVGTTIIRSLHIQHPIGDMMTKSILSHDTCTGDHTKSLVFFLAGALRAISRTCLDADNLTRQRTTQRTCIEVCNGISSMFNILELDIIPRLIKNSIPTSLEDRNMDEITSMATNIIRTAMCGHLSHNMTNHFIKILRDYIFSSKDDAVGVVNMLQWGIDNSDNVFIRSSYADTLKSHVLFGGFVIEREFAVTSDTLQDSDAVKMVLIDCDLEPDVEDAVFMQSKETDTEHHIKNIVKWKTEVIEAFIRQLVQYEVKVVISSYSTSAAVRHICYQNAISVVDSVPSDYLQFIANMLNIQILYSPSDCGEEYIYTVTKSSVNIGKHVVFGCDDKNVRQIIICCPDQSTYKQYSHIMSRAKKCVIQWLKPSHDAPHIAHALTPGSFEVLMSQILDDLNTGRIVIESSSKNQSSIVVASDAVKEGLLSINTIVKMNLHGKIRPVTTVSTNCARTDFEPLYSKIAMVQHGLQLLQHILRIDHIVPVKNVRSQ